MKEEERELWCQYHNNPNFQVKDKLILFYLPLVKYLAARLAIHLPFGISKEDLESCGVMGLLEALKKFNPKRGVNFTSFARHRVKGAMIDEIRRLSLVPRRLWNQINKVEQAKKELALTEEEVNDQRIAAKTGLSLEDIKKIDACARQTQLAYLSQEDFLESKSLFDLDSTEPTEPLEIILKEEKHQDLAQAISSLEERDKLILALYYQEGLTLKEIGLVLNITESRVCQLHTRAIKALREKLKEMSYV
ncbi:MAG: FliA/WhiG family RNA polymerase sigma factor [Peptococcaceae bacterium]